MTNLETNKIIIENTDAYNKASELLFWKSDFFWKEKVIDNNKIIFFWSIHSNNSKHKQFIILKSLFSKFIRDTENKKHIVFIESSNWEQWLVEDKSEEEVISHFAEPWFMIKLAKIYKTEIFCPEPSRKERIHDFQKENTDEQIFYFCIIGWYRLWYMFKKHTPTPCTFEEYYTNRDKWDLISTLSLPSNISWEYFISLHKKLVGQPRDITSHRIKYDATNPTINDFLFTNKMARNQFRDFCILQQIENYINNWYDIFIVYGSGHLIQRKNIFEY